MPALNPSSVPDAVLTANPARERVSSTVTALREVPAVLGWAAHAALRTPDALERTHVCASSYDHLNIDLRATRVAALYAAHPQPETVLSLAGQPGAVSIADALARLHAWDAPPAPSVPDSPLPDELYAAAPVFVLHAAADPAPLAIVACRYYARHRGPEHVFVELHLDAVAVDPARRRAGLGHLALLEASRWLGMLTRNLRLSEREAIVLEQEVHAVPLNAAAYHYAQAFLSNYMYFSVSDELIDDARDSRRAALLETDSVRAGHAAIATHLGVADLVEVPADAVDYLQDEPMDVMVGDED